MELENQIPEESTPSCPVCEEAGAPSAEEAVVAAPAAAEGPKKAEKKRTKPHLAVRALLQFTSFVLCVVLLAGLVAAVAVADARAVTTKEGIKQIVGSMFAQPQHPAVLRPVVGTAGFMSGAFPEGESPFGGAIPDAMIDFVMGQLEQLEIEAEINKEKVEEFLEQSTITDFVTDKMASYVEDFITGESNTTITPEEIEQLVDENKELLESQFGVEIPEEITDQLTDTITDFVEENDISQIITGEAFGDMGDVNLGGDLGGLGNLILGGGSDSTGGSGSTGNPGASQGVSINTLLATLRTSVSDAMLYTVVGVCAVLMVLLCLCNFYNLPAGLNWAGFPCVLLGVLLSAPTALVLSAPETLLMVLGGDAMTAKIVTTVLTLVSPVHYTVLVVGIVLMVLSIVVRIIRAVVRKKRLQTV